MASLRDCQLRGVSRWPLVFYLTGKPTEMLPGCEIRVPSVQEDLVGISVSEFLHDALSVLPKVVSVACLNFAIADSVIEYIRPIVLVEVWWFVWRLHLDDVRVGCVVLIDGEDRGLNQSFLFRLGILVALSRSLVPKWKRTINSRTNCT